jgi:site-specific recombinase XerD
MLSLALLETLREYWISSDPKPYTFLFPGRNHEHRINPRSVQHLMHVARKKAGLERKVSPHLLRHTFGTHLLENGTNIRIIQTLMGHRSLSTTAMYTHVAKNYINETTSPLDTINDPDKKKEE